VDSCVVGTLFPSSRRGIPLFILQKIEKSPAEETILMRRPVSDVVVCLKKL